MKPCVYRGQQRGERYDCWNSKELVHTGTVHADTCDRCPYARTPDFFAQTERLAVQLSGAPYRPAPKSCGGCGTVKRRDTATQFVWPYFHGAASGDELRWSVRSVEAFFQGPTKITIVGDRPPWYRGHVIDQPRIGPCANRGFRDMLAKMQTMGTHPEIDREFVWMMDDIYFLRPVSWDDLETPRAYPWARDKSNQWQRRKYQSMEALRARGKPQHDYATHLPHTVEQAKLAALFEEYDLRNNTLLWEVLYGNHYRPTPYGCSPFFARLQQRYTLEDLQRVTEGASVCNHLAQLWTPEMRAFLAGLLPQPASSEIEDATYRPALDRKSTRLNSSHVRTSRMPSSA